MQPALTIGARPDNPRRHDALITARAVAHGPGDRPNCGTRSGDAPVTLACCRRRSFTSSSQGSGDRRCERICEPNAAKHRGQPGMRRSYPDRQSPLTCEFETRTAKCDSHRLAHNPEVAGSNPVPATSRNGPRRSLRGPFSCLVGTLLGTLAKRTVSGELERSNCATRLAGLPSLSVPADRRAGGRWL
jgi:hypothetical protein